MSDVKIMYGFSFTDVRPDEIKELDSFYDKLRDIEVVTPYSIAASDIDTAAVGFAVQEIENFQPTELQFSRIENFLADIDQVESIEKQLHEVMDVLSPKLRARAEGPHVFVYMHNDD